MAENINARYRYIDEVFSEKVYRVYDMNEWSQQCVTNSTIEHVNDQP